MDINDDDLEDALHDALDGDEDNSIPSWFPSSSPSLGNSIQSGTAKESKTKSTERGGKLAVLGSGSVPSLGMSRGHDHDSEGIASESRLEDVRARRGGGARGSGTRAGALRGKDMHADDEVRLGEFNSESENETGPVLGRLVDADTDEVGLGQSNIGSIGSSIGTPTSPPGHDNGAGADSRAKLSIMAMTSPLEIKGRLHEATANARSPRGSFNTPPSPSGNQPHNLHGDPLLHEGILLSAHTTTESSPVFDHNPKPAEVIADIENRIKSSPAANKRPFPGDPEELPPPPMYHPSLGKGASPRGAGNPESFAQFVADDRKESASSRAVRSASHDDNPPKLCAPPLSPLSPVLPNKVASTEEAIDSQTSSALPSTPASPTIPENPVSASDIDIAPLALGPTLDEEQVPEEKGQFEETFQDDRPENEPSEQQPQSHERLPEKEPHQDQPMEANDIDDDDAALEKELEAFMGASLEGEVAEYDSQLSVEEPTDDPQSLVASGDASHANDSGDAEGVAEPVERVGSPNQEEVHSTDNAEPSVWPTVSPLDVSPFASPPSAGEDEGSATPTATATLQEEGQEIALSPIEKEIVGSGPSPSIEEAADDEQNQMNSKAQEDEDGEGQTLPIAAAVVSSSAGMNDDEFLVLDEDRMVDPTRLAHALPLSSSATSRPKTTPEETERIRRERARLQDEKDRREAQRTVPFALSLGATSKPLTQVDESAAADPETRAKLRQERLERERASDQTLAQVRRQYEQASIASGRSLDYLKKRKRQQSLARECARRMTFSPQTHQSRMPPPDDEDVAKELKDNPFTDGWRAVFRAFHVGEEEDLIKSSRADEEFNSYLLTAVAVDVMTVRDYLLMVLDGAAPSALVRRVVRLPPEQYDPDPALRVPSFAMGRCLKAAPYVFNALMSAQLDIYAERRKGLGVTKEDAMRLLNTAKGHVESFITLTMEFLMWRYHRLNRLELVTETGGKKRGRTVARECIQAALGEMFFDRGLGLFYYQIYAEEDTKIARTCQTIQREPNMNLLSLAKRFGLPDKLPVMAALEPRTEDLLLYWRDAFESKVCPMEKLALIVRACKSLGEGGMSGDDLLPLVVSAVALTLPPGVRLYSLVQLLDDFALIVKSGEDAFVLSMLMTATEVLLHEKDESAQE